MASGSTYTPIATTTLGTASASVTFNSIFSAYTDLVLVMNWATTSGSAGAAMRVGNGSPDSGNNYSQTYMEAFLSGAISGRETNTSTFYISENDGGTNDMTIIHLMNYANTNTYKTFLMRGNHEYTSTFWETILDVGLWRSTAAINTVNFWTTTSSFTAGSTFTLYGIAAA